MHIPDEKDLRMISLEKENMKLQDKIKDLEHNVEALTQALLQSNKKRFGASSEKTPASGMQITLWGEEQTFEKTGSRIINIKEHKRPVRTKGDREKLTINLRRETVECVIDKDDAFCDICESELKVIGKKKVRSEMDYIPASLVIKDYIQYMYKCTGCGSSDESPSDRIIGADVPAPVLTHSIASPSAVAWIMYQKYRLSVPFYRQERDFARMGAPLKRDMMSYWLIRSAQRWLKPLYDRMHIHLLKRQIIMSDETTWQVNKEKGKLPSSKSYIWIHRSGDCGDPPIILYEYTRTRAGEHAKEFLRGFRGFHVSDAYTGYEKVEGITRCLCYSHLRRYYLEAIPLDSGKKEIKGSGGAIGRNYCDQLFRLERKWKTLPPEERRKKRLQYSVPKLLEFFAWAQNTVTGQEPLRKALNYTLNHKKYFMNFLLDGRIPISNNLSEIAVRPVAITRKNALFSDSVDGAVTSAIIFSIVSTAVANAVDPYRYLEHIFRQLPNCDLDAHEEILDEYMPWSEKMQAAFKVYDCKDVNAKTGELEDESA